GIRDRTVTGVQTCALPIFIFNPRQHLSLLSQSLSADLFYSACKHAQSHPFLCRMRIFHDPFDLVPLKRSKILSVKFFSLSSFPELSRHRLKIFFSEPFVDPGICPEIISETLHGI